MAKVVWRAIALIAAAVIVVLWLLLASMDDASPHARCPKCNVIIVSVDALRADHLGIYGYGRNTSANVDRFAESSVVFDNAVTPKPQTNPSLASMLTGLYPYKHGVRSYSVPMTQMKTLPGALRDSGFVTAAIVSNWALQQNLSGMDRYFDFYDYNFTNPEMNRKDIYERNAEDTNKAVLDWLGKNEDSQFFLWIHYMDPHGPYYAPQEYRGWFKTHTERWVNVSGFPEYIILPDAPLKGGLTDEGYYVDQYDGEIRYFDAQFGRLLDELDRRGLTNDTLIMFTADHGEALGEHGYYTHGDEVYEDNIRIPLIVRFPDKHPRGLVRVGPVVSIMDVYPTVLDYVGLDVGSAGQIDGRSVLPVIDGDSGGSLVFSEALQKGCRVGGVTMVQMASLRGDELKITFAGNCSAKRLGGECKGEYACYNLSVDPLELHGDACGEEAFGYLNRTMLIFLRNMTEQGVYLRGGAATAQDTQILKSLGYMN